jgi:hypothetical protein
MNRRPPPLSQTLRVLWLLGVPHALEAQAPDQAVMTIRIGGAEVGIEKFSVIPMAGGTRIVSDVTFTASRPPLEFSLSLERSSPTDFAFQFRRSASPSAQFFAILGKERLTLRRIEVGTEEASESRGTPDLVPLADSMVAPLLQLVPAEGEPERSLTAIYPQGGRRVRIVATRSAGGDGGARITLSGGLDGVLELAPDGTLLRAALPGLKLEAERQAP